MQPEVAFEGERESDLIVWTRLGYSLVLSRIVKGESLTATFTIYGATLRKLRKKDKHPFT